MTTIVSTGQITIVDNNDARPLTAFISATPSAQQVYTKDESAVSFTPDWTTENSNLGIEFRARVYAGKSNSSEDVTRQLTNKRWSYDLSTAITAGAANTTYWNESSTTGVGSVALVDNDTDGVRLRIRANLKPAATTTAPRTIYFEGDYTDPVTGLVSRVVASIVVSQVKTGTNAVYINLRAPDGTVLEPGLPTNPKNSVRIFADLIRANGVDDTGVTYKWFESPHAAANQIDGNLSGVTTKYGLLDTTAAGANRAVVVGQLATGSGTTAAAITASNVPDGTYGDYKGLAVYHTAVTDIGVYKVEARDSDGTVYQTFFTITDVSDPYEVRLISLGGDKLQNGVGSTDVYPTVYYGEAKVTDLTSWTFDWQFYMQDATGALTRGAFVDPTKTAASGGRTITGNLTTKFTYSGTAIAFAAGDIIKAVSGSKAELFEVASVIGNEVTVRTPTTNTWIPAANFTGLGADEFINGKLFAMSASKTTNGANANDAAAKIVITGDDIDAKGTIICTANKP